MLGVFPLLIPYDTHMYLLCMFRKVSLERFLSPARERSTARPQLVCALVLCYVCITYSVQNREMKVCVLPFPPPASLTQQVRARPFLRICIAPFIVCSAILSVLESVSGFPFSSVDRQIFPPYYDFNYCNSLPSILRL